MATHAAVRNLTGLARALAQHGLMSESDAESLQVQAQQGSVTFVEQSAPAVRVLQDNLETSRFLPQATIVRLCVDRALQRLHAQGARFDGVLLDPPYESKRVGETLRLIDRCDLVSDGGWVVAEHHVDEHIEPEYGALQLTQSRRYGKTGVALFTKRG